MLTRLGGNCRAVSAWSPECLITIALWTVAPRVRLEIRGHKTVWAVLVSWVRLQISRTFFISAEYQYLKSDVQQHTNPL